MSLETISETQNMLILLRQYRSLQSSSNAFFFQMQQSFVPYKMAIKNGVKIMNRCHIPNRGSFLRRNQIVISLAEVKIVSENLIAFWTCQEMNIIAFSGVRSAMQRGTAKLKMKKKCNCACLTVGGALNRLEK